MVKLFAVTSRYSCREKMWRLIAAASLTLALSACGGGGSSGNVNSTPPPPTQFTSFTNVAANTSTVISGSTREGTAVVSSSGAILPSGVSDPTEGSGSVTFSVNAQRQTTSLSVNGGSSSVSFNSSSTVTPFVDTNGRAIATGLSNASGSDQALYADPYVLGFDYQSFGVWGTGLVPGSTARIGAISAGSRTGAASVPTAGSATFNGGVGGIYVDNAGIAFRYGAYATYDVN
jgi:hypothetical protein